MTMVRSFRPISGAPIFMALRSMAEARAEEEKRKRTDAQRVRIVLAFDTPRTAFGELLGSPNRRAALGKNRGPA
jgi:hypothetical protein